MLSQLNEVRTRRLITHETCFQDLLYNCIFFSNIRDQEDYRCLIDSRNRTYVRNKLQ